MPENEVQRNQALCRLNRLDTEPEARFDRITRLAKRMVEPQIALVRLVGCDRQWFNSPQGTEATESPRYISSCGHATLSDGVFVVSNALKDHWFTDHSLVRREPEPRFLADAEAPGFRAMVVIGVISRTFGAMGLPSEIRTLIQVTGHGA